MILCQNPECKKPATLQCPKCIELKLPAAHFCTQTCFKESWTWHKLLHNPSIGKSEQKANPLPYYFRNFEFTGTLRPTELTPRRTIPDRIEKPDYAITGDPISERTGRSSQIEVKSSQEIKAMQKVCRLAREVLDIAANAAKPGVTTDEIDRIVHEACIERDSYPSPLNYRGFPKSCCTSVNEVICHGIPDQRPLEDGDILNIDITLYHGGVHGDLNETYFIGNVDEASKKLVNTTRESLEKAIEIVKPGALYREIGNVIQKHVQEQGFSVVRSYCGHGIGRLFHTTPNVPHYAKNKAVGVMKPGHVFTIEPMINMGTWQDVLWPDDWTAVTKDGKRSAQFEHTLLVTETGCEVENISHLKFLSYFF